MTNTIPMSSSINDLETDNNEDIMLDEYNNWWRHGLNFGRVDPEKVEERNNRQIITHIDSKIFNDWGFVSEEPPYQQLTLILEEEIE